MERNYQIDNAKITLIFLVVFGHGLELANNNPILQTLYLGIYVFHIPMFVLISGMLAKAELNNKILFGYIDSVLIPFLVFEVLYEGLQFIRYGELSHYTLNLQPYWLLWFLWSLWLWKCLLPVLYCFKYPLLLSLIIALISGYSTHTGYYLGIARTLTFLPFFVLGHILKPNFFQRLQSIPRPFFIIIVLLAFSLIGYFNQQIPARWFYGSVPYAELGVTEWYAGLIRLASYLFSLIVGISIIALLPNKEIAITKYGERSLYIYIWHGFLIKLIVAIGLISFISQYGDYATLIILLLLSIVITFMLASKHISTKTEQLLFKPIKKIILKQYNE